MRKRESQNRKDSKNDKKINEIHISKWMSDDVELWIIKVLQQCGIPVEQIESFVKDLNETHLTGRTLESLNNDIEFEKFRRLYFSKKNQKNFTIWKEFELALRQLMKDMYPENSKIDRYGYYDHDYSHEDNYNYIADTNGSKNYNNNQYFADMNHSLIDDLDTISSRTTQDKPPYLVPSSIESKDKILLCQQHSGYTCQTYSTSRSYQIINRV